MSRPPKMLRREFLNNVAATAPSWLLFLSAFSPENLLAEETDGYDPTKHNYSMGVDVR